MRLRATRHDQMDMTVDQRRKYCTIRHIHQVHFSAKGMVVRQDLFNVTVFNGDNPVTDGRVSAAVDQPAYTICDRFIGHWHFFTGVLSWRRPS